MHLNRFISLVRKFTSRRRAERELDDELKAYLEELTDRNASAGMSSDQARRAALVETGGSEQVKELVRGVWAGHVLDDLLKDLRYGVRALRNSPAFAVTAVLTLATGIGINTAVFSIAEGLLLRPLPYPRADRIAVVYMRYAPRDFEFGTLSIKDFLTWKDHNRAFEAPSLFRTIRINVAGPEGYPEQVQGAAVSAGFFSTFGVQPLLGRTLGEGDDQATARPVAVLSESIWKRRFSGDRRILGKPVLLDGKAYSIVGIMPQAFQFPASEPEIWTNLALAPPTRYGPWFYRGIGRLRAGASVEQARAELARVAGRLMEDNPYYKRVGFPLLSLRDALVGTKVELGVRIFAAAVALVLLIVIMNVALLMLARATVREREMAVRASLGARRGRLIRQLLTESVLLAAAGGGIGLLLAYSAVGLLRHWNPGDLPMIEAIRIDGSALVFVTGTSLVTGILFGIVPALTSTATGSLAAIHDGGRGSVGSARRERIRAVLVVAQISVSLTLMIGAGLLLRTYINLQRVHAGFLASPDKILTVQVRPTPGPYSKPEAGLTLYRELLTRVRHLPGVEAVSVADALPPDRQWDADSFRIEGEHLASGEQNPIVTDATVGYDYFATVGIPLIRGRYFTANDGQKSVPVAIVSEGFVRRFLAGQDPIGRRMKQGSSDPESPWMEVVGVVGNVKYLGLAVDSDPAYYMPFDQNYSSTINLVVRANQSATTLADVVRREIHTLGPSIAVAKTETLGEAMKTALSLPRFDALLILVFAAVATVLAAIGIYGLTAYSVVQRRREIGLRIALGAEPRQVLASIARRGLVLAGIGIGTGLAAAVALTDWLSSILFGVTAADGLTFALAPLGILITIVAATLAPAIRATQIPPITALRYE